MHSFNKVDAIFLTKYAHEHLIERHYLGLKYTGRAIRISLGLSIV